MEHTLSHRLEAMDRRLNGLLRKAALVAVTLAAMALALVLCLIAGRLYWPLCFRACWSPSSA